MLIINQGVQNIENDNKFEIIKEKNVYGVITNIKMHDKFENTLSITIDIIDHPKYTGRKVWDDICYDPKSPHSWKYRALRKCVGKPYSKDEAPQIDAEALLLNQKVKMNLSGRIAQDGNEYQKITYIAKKVKEENPFNDEGIDDEETSPIEQDIEW